MTATDVFETAILQLIFENATIANIGDAGGLLKSVGDGDFNISLHTAALDDTSISTTSLLAYTGYADVVYARGTATWTVTTDTAANDAAITFPLGTGGSGTATDFGIGNNLDAVLHFFGVLDGNLVTGDGVQPEFAISALNITAA